MDPHLNPRPGKDTKALGLDSSSDTCHSRRPWTWSPVAELTDSKGPLSGLDTRWHGKYTDDVSAFPALGYVNSSEVFTNNCIYM